MVAVAQIVNADPPSASDQAWRDFFVGAGHTVTYVLDSTIGSSYDWSPYAAIVDRTAGNDYDPAHLSSTVPILFGSRDLIVPLGFATTDGVSINDSITPYNRPWTDVVTGETVVMTQGGVTLWFDSATKEPGVVVGGYAGPTADRRVVIAHHALTGQRRVFFGMTGNYATGFYDDLLLESLDLALNGPPGGYTPDDPPPPVIAYELVNDDLPTAQDPASHVAKPYVWFPSRHPGAPLALLPEGNRPKLWQVSYPEGYPDPGSELDDLWSRVGEKR